MCDHEFSHTLCFIACEAVKKPAAILSYLLLVETGRSKTDPLTTILRCSFTMNSQTPV